MKSHCCKQFNDYIEDSSIHLKYIPYLREYVVNTKDPMVVYQIYCCPICGKKFPSSLRDEFFDIFYDQLHLKRIKKGSIIDTPGLPEEFKSDEWWKKRGL